VHHNRKREVELKLMRLRGALEDQNVAETEIDAKVEETRRTLMAKLGDAPKPTGRTGETHTDAAMKQRENAQLKDALGISSSYVGGSAFDRELQEQQKAEKAAKREAEDAEREELMAVLEREKAREERRREKDERRREKEARKRQKREDKGK